MDDLFDLENYPQKQQQQCQGKGLYPRISRANIRTGGLNAWRSQFAVIVACQMPFKFGCPSVVRTVRGAWPGAGVWAFGIAVQKKAAAIVALAINAVG